MGRNSPATDKRQRNSVGVGVAIAFLVAVIAGLVAKNPDDFSLSALPDFKGIARAGDDTLIRSGLYDIAVEKITAPHDPGQGGAIETLQDEVYLITRRGDFFRLNDGRAAFEPVALTPPAPFSDNDDFYKRAKDRASLGYKDFKMRARGDGIEITLSDARVDPETPCVGLVVSQTVVAHQSLKAGAAPLWREIWRSNPCIRSAGGSFPFQAGGDMAFLNDGRIAIFVGDFGVDGHNRKTAGINPQTLDNDYGKVIAIDPETGDAEILSRGHRNPGGLAIGPDGALWQSEHGAQGGDEINRIIAGKNYGWPFETYGVHYGTRDWPLDPTTGDHDRFTRPVFAFVPSMAVSSLALMEGDEFALWENDLILGTLKYQRLIRLHIREARVIFAEPLLLGARVRDLAVDAKGAVYVKDDERPVVYRLTNANDASPIADNTEAALVAAGCASCHNDPAVAPALNGLIGRDIASVSGYRYSPALSAKRGAWDADALRAFLTDPQAFAPGGAMPAPDLSEAQIEELAKALEG